jgi:hypothetical protein
MTSTYLERPLRSEAEITQDIAMADRVFRATYGYPHDAADERDRARMAWLVRVMRDIRAAGLAIVEADDGR